MSMDENTGAVEPRPIEIPAVEAFELYREYEEIMDRRSQRDDHEDGSPDWDLVDGEMLDALWKFVDHVKSFLPDALSLYYFGE